MVDILTAQISQHNLRLDSIHAHHAHHTHLVSKSESSETVTKTNKTILVSCATPPHSRESSAMISENLLLVTDHSCFGYGRYSVYLYEKSSTKSGVHIIGNKRAQSI